MSSKSSPMTTILWTEFARDEYRHLPPRRRRLGSALPPASLLLGLAPVSTLGALVTRTSRILVMSWGTRPVRTQGAGPVCHDARANKTSTSAKATEHRITPAAEALMGWRG